MTNQSECRKPNLEHIIELILTDFGLPGLIILICGLLLLCGQDSEIKTVFVMGCGWIFKSAYDVKFKNNRRK